MDRGRSGLPHSEVNSWQGCYTFSLLRRDYARPFARKGHSLAAVHRNMLACARADLTPGEMLGKYLLPFARLSIGHESPKVRQLSQSSDAQMLKRLSNILTFMGLPGEASEFSPTGSAPGLHQNSLRLAEIEWIALISLHWLSTHFARYFLRRPGCRRAVVF